MLRIMQVLVGTLSAAAALASVQARDSVTLASATTPEATGLFEHLLPAFECKTGIDVRIISVGTGQALEIARRGDADMVLVHHPPAERRFVANGHGLARHSVMENDFVLVGPAHDPAGVSGIEDAALAVKRIAAHAAPFVSRGDDSGTHRKELELWQAAEREVSRFDGTWYRETGAGMGRTLNLAAAMRAYTLTDRGTWLALKNRQGLRVLVEGDPRLINPYSVIRIDPERHPHGNADGARRFIEWLTGYAGQQRIAEYRLRGQSPFHPRAAESSPIRARADSGGSSRPVPRRSTGAAH